VFVADCDLRLGIAYYRLGLWLEAEEAIKQGLKVVNRRKRLLAGSKTELRLLGYLGLVRLRRDNPREALQIFNERVEPLVSLHSSTYVTATFHHRRALVHTSLQQYEEAHRDIEQALSLRITCEAQFEVSRTLFYLGRLCAREYHRRAAVAIWSLCEQRHLLFADTLGMARVQLDLGRSYVEFSRLGRPDEKAFFCDVFEAELSDLELAAISNLARGFRSDPEDGVRTELRFDQENSLAAKAFASAIYWADKAREPAIRAAAENAFEELRGRTARPHRLMSRLTEPSS
jgi:tetratricopeptide (TPR) repeat protein